MTKGKKTLKIYHGIILALLTAGEIFIFSRYLGNWFGFYGTLISELILLLLAVGTVAAAGGKYFPHGNQRHARCSERLSCGWERFLLRWL